MPGTGNAAIQDLALTQRPVLVLAHVGNGRDLALILEHGHPFTRQAYQASALPWNISDSAGIYEAVLIRCVTSRMIRRRFPECRGKMKSEHEHHTESNCRDVKGARLSLQNAERDMQHEQPIGGIN